MPFYRELLQITRWTMQYAADAVPILYSLSNVSAWGAAASLEYYLGLAKGDLTPPEVEGRSQVVSPDVRNTIEALTCFSIVRFHS